jgi:hypothetical protein
VLKIKSFLITFAVLFGITFQALATVRFVQFSDPHIFEDPKRAPEAKASVKDFHAMVKSIPQESNEFLDFVVMTGDMGVGKLLKMDPATGKHIKDPAKWSEGLTTLAEILKDSSVKKWFFVPGNNDLYEEQPETIRFYQDFLKELQAMPMVKKAGLTLIDFRLEAPSTGMYVIKDLLFVGWDNSFFKNNNSVKHYRGKDGKVIPFAQTLEYKSVQKLSKSLEDSKAKYAYIFYHIPDIDDPYLILPEASNIVSKRLQEAKDLSTAFEKGFYPYSAWTVPPEVRQAWENVVTRKSGKGPVIKGLFVGHFHDHKKQTYLTTTWVGDKNYNPEILNKLYLAPPVSLKLQGQYPPSHQARGSQIVTIDDNGDVSRKAVWLG